MDEVYLESRLLQTEEDSAAAEAAAPLTQTEIIQSTCLIYGSIFAVLFILFLILRPRYPNVYNIKKSFPSLNTPVANDSFGFVSWMWKVFEISYDDISDQCGMDAVTTIRLLEMGVKLSLVGVFNSGFLIPVYALMGSVVADSGEDDPVKAVSLSNLDQGNHGTIATTVAAYIFFGYAMHLIDKDLEWFTSHRHKFLSRKRVANYSVFLSGLTPDMQTNKSLREYFTSFFDDDAVADVHVTLTIPKLEKKVAARNALLPKLEHAINVQDVKGEIPMHKINKKMKVCGGEKVESVPTYSKDIGDLNMEIVEGMDKIGMVQKEREEGDDVEAGEGEREASLLVQALPDDDDIDSSEQEEAKNDAKGRRSSLSDSVKSGASKLKSVIINTKEDGAPRNAAFVSFANLTFANLARQAVHSEEPWNCVPHEPPLPELVNWKNVGKSNQSKQIGELASFVLTAVLCIFWTIPVTFVASLSNVEELTGLLPFLTYPVENYSWFSTLLALLAPLLLVVFISLLPVILLAFLKLEGLIEIETYQHPSLFSKLASFTILQTFFVSTIAGTLSTSIQDIINNPTSGMFLLAEAIPSQSAYFIQIILVQNLLGLGIELLRISAAVQNILRKFVSNKLGHNLTEKERNETFMGLRHLADPIEFYFGRELGSKHILVLMVLYVYGCMSPVTSYFTLLVFGLLAIGFRHQFIFTYPIGNDSGGDLWIKFTRLSITCMIVAEIVLFAVLLLNKALIAGPLLVPLIIITILFDIYFKRRHYQVTHYLPLGYCAEIDHENESQGMPQEWLKDAYLQPALLKNTPENNQRGIERVPSEEETLHIEESNAGVLADYHKEQGNFHMSAKEYKLALQEYSKAIDAAPSSPNTHIYYSNRAAAYCYLSKYNAAAADCRKSMEINPQYAKAHTRLGLSLYFQGDYEGAIAAYEKSLDLDPTNESAFNYLVKAKEKERSMAQRHDEFEIGWGGGLCSPFGKSQSFDCPEQSFDD